MQLEQAAPASALITITVPRIGAQWPGEDAIYAGIVRGDEGQPDYHLLVPTAPELQRADLTWKDAMDWARAFEGAGYVVPNRRELRVLIAGVPELFEPEWHWSSEQYAGNPSYAWAQHFSDGNQNNYHHSNEFRCRLVRRSIRCR